MGIMSKIDNPLVWRTLLYGGLLGLSAPPREQPYGTFEPFLKGLAGGLTLAQQQVAAERKQREEEERLKLEKELNEIRKQQAEASRLSAIARLQQATKPGKAVMFINPDNPHDFKVVPQEQLFDPKVVEELSKSPYVVADAYRHAGAMYKVVWDPQKGPMYVDVSGMRTKTYPAPVHYTEVGRNPIDHTLLRAPTVGPYGINNAANPSQPTPQPKSSSEPVDSAQYILDQLSNTKSRAEAKKVLSPYFDFKISQTPQGQIIKMPVNVQIKGQKLAPSDTILQMGELKNIMNELQQVVQIAQQHPEWVGPWDYGVEGRFKQYTEHIDPARAAFYAKLVYLKTLVYGFSGKQINEKEIKMLGELLPSGMYSVKTILGRAHEAMRILNNLIAQRASALHEAGYYIPDSLINYIADLPPYENPTYKAASGESNSRVNQFLKKKGLM